MFVIRFTNHRLKPLSATVNLGYAIFHEKFTERKVLRVVLPKSR